MPLLPAAAIPIAGSLLGKAVGALSPNARAHRQILREDVDKYRKGTLGPSYAEREQQAGMAARQAGAAQQVANQQLAQQMGGAGGQMSGKMLAQQGQLAQNIGNARSTGMNVANQQGQQLAEARRQELVGRMSAQGQQNMAHGQQFGQMGGELAPYATEPIASAFGRMGTQIMEQYLPWKMQ